jgi:hypothetical protein
VGGARRSGCYCRHRRSCRRSQLVGEPQ